MNSRRDDHPDRSGNDHSDRDLGAPAEANANAERAGRRNLVWAPVAAIVGICAVVTAVVVPLVLHRDSGPSAAHPEPSGLPTATPAGDRVLPPDQGAGVPVEGTGTLLKAADGGIRLCAQVAVALSLPPASAGCDEISLPVTGVPDRWFTNTAMSGQQWSENVHVQGTLHQGILSVTQVGAAVLAPALSAEPPVPCAPPTEGWRLGTGVTEGEADAINRLVEHVRAHPDRYTDLWEAHPDGAPKAENSYAPTRSVYAVGSLGDLGRARAELAAIFKGNLCVYQVTHSAAQLESIAARLRTAGPSAIVAEPMVIENKIRVRVVALDQATNAILDSVGRELLVVDQPLLQWLD
jgi:hypothetical protein